RVAGPALLGGLGLLLLSGVGVGGFCGAGRTGLRALLLGVGRLGPLLGPVLLGGLLRWPAGVVRVGGRCCPGVRSLSGRSICAGLYLVALLFGAALVGVALGGLSALLRALFLVGVPRLGLLRVVLPFGVGSCGGSRLLLRCGGVRAAFGSAVGRLRRGGFRARGGPVRVLHRPIWLRFGIVLTVSTRREFAGSGNLTPGLLGSGHVLLLDGTPDCQIASSHTAVGSGKLPWSTLDVAERENARLHPT